MKNKNVILLQPLDKLNYFTNIMEPIAVETLASVIEKKGYNAFVLPTNTSKDDFLKTIEELKPVAVGFSVYTYSYLTALCLAQASKKKAKELGYDLITIFGGYHPTAQPEDVILNPQVDFVVLGEGEITFLELLDTIEQKKSLDTVKGIVFKQNDEITKTASRQRIKNLDSLPNPKRYQKYLYCQTSSRIQYPAATNQKSVARIIYGRGCPFGCKFCQAKNMLGTEIYWRTPNVVLDEIEMLIKKFGTNYLVFLDLTFNVSKKKVFELCDEFIKRDLPVYWSVNVRADLLEKDQLLAMKEAKCSKIAVGIECPSEIHVKNLKGSYSITQEHLCEILQFSSNIGLLIRLYMMIGFLHETKEMILGYPRIWQKYAYDEMLIAFATPLPATDFFEECKRQNLFIDPMPWQDFNLENPTIDLPQISKKELRDLHKELYKQTYFHESYINYVKEKLNNFPHLASSWIGHFEVIKNMGYAQGVEKEYNELMQIICSHI